MRSSPSSAARIRLREGLRRARRSRRRIFRRVSFDLIYALPGDDEAGWSRTLDRALGTRHRPSLALPADDRAGHALRRARWSRSMSSSRSTATSPPTLYELTAERTADAGMPAYEISNHARPGQESRHNLTYWRYGDYAGVGPGAHGRRLGKRTMRHRKPENFLSGDRPQRPRHGRGRAAEPRRKRPTKRWSWACGCPKGSTPGAIAERLGVRSIVDWEAVERLVGSGHLKRTGDHIAATPSGRLVLDHLLGADCRDRPRSLRHGGSSRLGSRRRWWSGLWFCGREP